MEQREPDRLIHGAIGGALAGIVVVIWFLVMDMVAGHPFDTPARLSSAVLRTEFTGPWPRLMMLYTVLHFGVFIALGVAAVWTLEMLKIQPGIIVGGVFAIGVLNTVHYAGLLVTGTNLLTIVPIQQVVVANLFGGTLIFGSVGMASSWIVQEMGWLTILVANGLAVVGMSSWIWHRHPGLRRPRQTPSAPVGI